MQWLWSSLSCHSTAWGANKSARLHTFIYYVQIRRTSFCFGVMRNKNMIKNHIQLYKWTVIALLLWASYYCWNFRMKIETRTRCMMIRNSKQFENWLHSTVNAWEELFLHVWGWQTCTAHVVNVTVFVCNTEASLSTGWLGIIKAQRLFQ